jgi:choline dehydrogenase
MREQQTETFDYIVVGGGTAGCVVAARLAERGRGVLVLEAGKFQRGPLVSLPAGFAVNLSNTAMLWEFQTEPTMGTAGRSHRMPRGKGVGGSSLVNGMAYERGHAHDYDQWRDLGCAGWGWDDVEPYFRRLEAFEGDLPGLGHNGPLGISPPRGLHPLTHTIMRAAIEAGVPPKSTLNDGAQEGVAVGDCAIRDGRRCSAYSAYLAKQLRRPNLTVKTDATVHRIEIEGGRASGVSYEVDGQPARALAGAEVIVCAGALKSPQLLELSGIGDAGRLQRLGVPVILHAPGVGEALQDHYAAPFQLALARGGSMNDWTRPPQMAFQLMRYLWNRSGLLSFGAAQARAFVRSRPEVDRPDVLIHLAPASLDQEAIMRGKVAFERRPGVTLSPVQLRPRSRGACHAATPDSRAPPVIAMNYLSCAHDEETIVAGLMFAHRIATQPALADLGATLAFPAEDPPTPSLLLDHAKAHGSTLHHPAGSCRMGGREAPLDPFLRVRGVRGLRVVDASVMPELVSAPIYGPVLMLAEKAADLIASDAGGAWPGPAR